MKSMRLVLAIALVVTSLLVGVMGVSADDGSWVSGIMVQNQDLTEAADITIEFYWAEGEGPAGAPAPVYTHSDTLAAGEAKSYYVPNLSGVPEGFVGSAVVKSNKPIAANLNTQVPGPASGGIAGQTEDYPNRVGTASGVLTDQASTSLYFTQVMKAYYGWNSYVAVQNTSADTDATVTLTYYSDSGAQAGTDTQTVSPNTTYIFRQSESALADGFSGSVKVESTQPVAGIANFYAAGDSYSSAQFHSYNGAGSGATSLWAPRIVTDYYGYNGGLRVQNIGSAQTDVTMTFTFGGVDYTETITGLQPGAAAGPYMGVGSRPAAIETAGVSASGSVKITSSGQDIIATVNEDNRTLGRGTTYNAVAEGSGSTGLLFPQMTSRYYGYSGGVQVLNEGSSAANVTITYSASGHTDVVKSYSIPAGQSMDWYTPNEGVAAGFNGSVTVVADQPVVGIANYSYQQGSNPEDGWAANYGDSYVTYNAIVK